MRRIVLPAIMLCVGLVLGFAWGVHWRSSEPELIWTVQYDGYGRVQNQGSNLQLTPRPSVAPDETHAALVVAGNDDWSDYRFQVRMRVDQQLRENSAPNPWETGWLFFRYQSSGSTYYLVHKTNGLELGKLVRLPDGGTSQVFLATTDDSPAEIGHWYQYQVVTQGAKLQVFVDGLLRIDYTDPDPIPNGGVGLYTEDADVQFESPVVTMSN